MAVTQAMALGIDTILSSGGAGKAVDGIAELAAMTPCGRYNDHHAGQRGARPKTLPLWWRKRVRAVHASCARRVETPDLRSVAMGFAPTFQAITDRDHRGRLARRAGRGGHG
jgi:copper homeostasis protein CutC